MEYQEDSLAVFSITHSKVAINILSTVLFRTSQVFVILSAAQLRIFSVQLASWPGLKIQNCIATWKGIPS